MRAKAEAVKRITVKQLTSEHAMRAFSKAEYQNRHHGDLQELTDDQRLRRCLIHAFAAAAELEDQ